MPMQKISPFDAWQKRETLLLGAVAQQQRRALPVGDPMRPDRGAVTSFTV
jgi:hypothetical protein